LGLRIEPKLCKVLKSLEGVFSSLWELIPEPTRWHR